MFSDSIEFSFASLWARINLVPLFRPRVSFRQTVYDIVVNNTDPIINLKRAISDLEYGIVNPELLIRNI